MAAAQFAATRTVNNTIQLYLSPNHTVPVPAELREEITPDVWAGRLSSITQTASRYNKPILERIWLVVGFLSIVILPVALFPVILSAAHFKVNSTSRVFEARAISFGIFVGMFILVFVPMVIWKYIGQKQVNSLLKKWEKEDQQGRGSMPLSTWKVKSPGVFRSSIILKIQLPPGKTVSSFNFNAYLSPALVNAPTDPDANYYYPYKSEPGLPRMSVVGNVPLFTDEKRGYYGSEKV